MTRNTETAAQRRAAGRAQLAAYMAPRPRRRSRRHVYFFVPLPVMLATAGIALPFVMLRDAGRIFRRVFMDPRTVVFAGFVMLSIASAIAAAGRGAASLMLRASGQPQGTSLTQAAGLALKAAWHRAMDTGPQQPAQAQGRHRKQSDTLPLHFPARGRWE